MVRVLWQKLQEPIHRLLYAKTYPYSWVHSYTCARIHRLHRHACTPITGPHQHRSNNLVTWTCNTTPADRLNSRRANIFSQLCCFPLTQNCSRCFTIWNRCSSDSPLFGTPTTQKITSAQRTYTTRAQVSQAVSELQSGWGRSATWAEAADVWMNTLLRTRSDTTLRSIRSKLAPFLNSFGAEHPSEMTYDRFEDWYQDLGPDMMMSTKARLRAETIRLIRMQNAALADLLKLNKIKVPLPKITTLKDFEWLKVKSWVEENITSSSLSRARLAAYVSVISTSGMRPAECCALRWNAWDVDSLQFHLTHTKTRESRFARVHPWTRDMLKEWRSAIPTSEWVFPTSSNVSLQIDPVSMRKYMQIVKVETDIPHLNSKCFRATLVKRVIESGGSYQDAAAIVGHASTSTTSNFYHRISMNDQAITAHEHALRGLMGDPSIAK